jgi:hypothetical protein
MKKKCTIEKKCIWGLDMVVHVINPSYTRRWGRRKIRFWSLPQTKSSTIWGFGMAQVVKLLASRPWVQIPLLLNKHTKNYSKKILSEKLTESKKGWGCSHKESSFSIKVCRHLSCLQYRVLVHWAPFWHWKYYLPHPPNSKCSISQLWADCAPEPDQSK